MISKVVILKEEIQKLQPGPYFLNKLAYDELTKQDKIDRSKYYIIPIKIKSKYDYRLDRLIFTIEYRLEKKKNDI